jgi:hypothetical protein
MNPGTLQRKIKELPQKISEWCDKIIKDNADLIIEWNKKQLEAGIGADDRKILATGTGGSYRPFTIRARKKLGLQTAVVDLKVTGTLYGHIKLKKLKLNLWEILNDDPELKTKLKFVTKDNFGLNEKHMEQLTEIIFDDVTQYMRGYFNG